MAISSSMQPGSLAYRQNAFTNEHPKMSDYSSKIQDVPVHRCYHYLAGVCSWWWVANLQLVEDCVWRRIWRP